MEIVDTVSNILFGSSKNAILRGKIENDGIHIIEIYYTGIFKTRLRIFLDGKEIATS